MASPGVGGVRGAGVRRRPVGAAARAGAPARPGRTTRRAAAPPVVDRRCAWSGLWRSRRRSWSSLPDGRLPIPPGPGALVTPSYTGHAGHAPTRRLEVPQHPGLAANGRSSMHNDGWASDSYPGPGPLGRDPEVDTAWYGLEECATLAFDQRERLVALCGDLRGPVLHVLDRDMQPLATKRLPDRPDVEGKKPWENLCAGAYFYLDDQDHAVVATTDRRVLEFATSDADGDADLSQVRSYDVSGEVPAKDCLIALMPDWAGRSGSSPRTGGSARSTPRRARCPCSTSARRSTTRSRSTSTGSTSSRSRRSTGCRRTTPAGHESTGGRRTTGARAASPASSRRGSGTTPTVLPGGRVAITDNADPRMNVVFYDAANGREVCRAPVFGPRTERHRELAGLRRRRGDRREQLRLRGPAEHAARAGDRTGPRPRRPRRRRVQRRLDQRRGRADLGAEGVAGQRAALRLHEAADPVGRRARGTSPRSTSAPAAPRSASAPASAR